MGPLTPLSGPSAWVLAAHAAPQALVPDVLFDGTTFRTEFAVVIDGDQVVSVQAVADLPATLQRLHLVGTLTPGLVDSHVHLLSFPKPMEQASTRTSWGKFAEEGMSGMVTHRTTTLLQGVTTVVDVGSPAGPLLALRRGIASGKKTGPRVLGVGAVITAVSGHPVTTTLVGDHDSIAQGTVQVADVQQCAAAVDGVVARGFDAIKVIVQAPEAHTPDLSDELVEAVVARAHHHGLSVIAHVEDAGGAQRALDAGVDALHHAFVADEALLERLAEAGVGWTPTLAMAAAEGADMAPILATVGRAHALGVRVTAGSGFPLSGGTALGDEVYRELLLLRDAGLAVEAVLGTAMLPLEPGQPADLVSFTTDLRREPPTPGAVQQVWQNGVPRLADDGMPTEAARSGLRRTNIVPQGYFYWEPILTGVVGAGFTAFDVGNTGSVAVFNAQYSLLNQAGVDLFVALPSPIPRTSLDAWAHADGFDALWYGRGNDVPETDALRYNDRLVHLGLKGDTALGSGLAVTTGLAVAWTTLTAVDGLPDHAGAAGGWLNTLSLAGRWDGRDNGADPWRGTWAQVGLDASHPLIGATTRTLRPSVEVRHYVPLLDWHVIAARVRVQQAFGPAIPFQQLPEFGGDVGRGFNPDRWVDALAVGAQLEYRGRLYKALQVATFVDVGQVAPSWAALGPADWHVAVGAGPRVRFNARAILAWDAGFGLGNDGVESFNLLFHMGHAF